MNLKLHQCTKITVKSLKLENASKFFIEKGMLHLQVERKQQVTSLETTYIGMHVPLHSTDCHYLPINEGVT